MKAGQPPRPRVTFNFPLADQELGDASRQTIAVLHLAFPYREHDPPGPPQLSSRPPVTLGVPAALGAPVIRIRRRRYPPVSAPVHVPETSVNVDDLSQPRKDDVRRAGESLHMESEAVAQPVDAVARLSARGEARRR